VRTRPASRNEKDQHQQSCKYVANVVPDRLLWVSSGPSRVYQLNDCYRVRTGRSLRFFQRQKFERLLSPRAAIQFYQFSLISPAEIGH
jgi:hypothetical protein